MTRWSPSKQAEAEQLRAAGAGWQAIGEALAVDESTVRYWLAGDERQRRIRQAGIANRRLRELAAQARKTNAPT